MSDNSEANRKHLWGRRYALVYRLQLSSLYHAKRARFFDLCDKTATAFSVLGSTAAIISVMNKGGQAEIAMSAAVAVVSTLSLVFSFSQKGRQHSELARDFRRLLGQVDAAGEYPTAQQIDRFCASCTELESQEPSPMTALVADCQNQLAARTGTRAVDLPWYQRWFKNLIDFPVEALPASSAPPGSKPV